MKSHCPSEGSLKYTPCQTLLVSRSAAFGTALRTARLKMGLTHYALARKLGVCEGSVFDYERGRALPSKPTMGGVLRVFPLLKSVAACLELHDIPGGQARTKSALGGLGVRERKRVRQVLIGSMLGDGYVRRVHSSYVNACFEEAHCAKHEEYTRWKAKQLRPLSPRIMKKFRTRDGRQMVWLQTRVDPFLTELRARWYRGRITSHGHHVKSLCTEDLEDVGILGLAAWHMEDGCYDYINGRVILCTQGFTRDENETLRGWLASKYGFRARVDTRGGRPSLVLRRGDSRRFLRMVRPHVAEVACMVYKLGPLHLANRKRVEEGDKKRAAEQRASYMKHRKKRLEWAKRYHEEHRQEHKRKCRAYYWANRERISQQKKTHYLANRDKILERERNWRRRNREKISRRRKAWYREHRQEAIQQARRWHDENRERAKQQRRDYYRRNKAKILQRRRGALPRREEEHITLAK